MVPVGVVRTDKSGLFIAKAVSALDAMATVQPSTALKTSINGLLKITISDRVVEKCRDGSGRGEDASIQLRSCVKQLWNCLTRS